MCILFTKKYYIKKITKDKCSKISLRIRKILMYSYILKYVHNYRVVHILLKNSYHLGINIYHLAY
jgi:hypothetical protein